MTKTELITLAEAAGFSAAVIPATQVPVDEKFRPYCEENLCGQYNANYSCRLCAERWNSSTGRFSGENWRLF